MTTLKRKFEQTSERSIRIRTLVGKHITFDSAQLPHADITNQEVYHWLSRVEGPPVQAILLLGAQAQQIPCNADPFEWPATPNVRYEMTQPFVTTVNVRVTTPSGEELLVPARSEDGHPIHLSAICSLFNAETPIVVLQHRSETEWVESSERLVHAGDAYEMVDICPLVASGFDASFPIDVISVVCGYLAFPL
jgi:hypothetical protein